VSLKERTLLALYPVLDFLRINNIRDKRKYGHVKPSAKMIAFLSLAKASLKEFFNTSFIEIQLAVVPRK